MLERSIEICTRHENPKKRDRLVAFVYRISNDRPPLEKAKTKI